MTIRWSPHSTAQVARRTTIHGTSGRYGFHGWVSDDLPVAPDDQGEQRGDDGHAPPTGAPPADPETRHDGGEVDDDGADLERPGRLPEQPVGRGQQVEAERAGVAALVRVRADPAGQADQRRVAREHVPDAELGHGQVEHRVPVIAGQCDDGDQQREPDDERRDGEHHTHPIPSSAGRADRRRLLQVGHGRESVSRVTSCPRAPPLGCPPRGRHRAGCAGNGAGDARRHRPRRPHRLRAGRAGRAAPTVRRRRRHMGRDRGRARARRHPPPRPLPLHGRDHGRGLHALLPRAAPPRLGAQRRLPPPLRPGFAPGADGLVRDLRALPRRRAHVRPAAAPRHHLRAVRAGPGLGAAGRHRGRRVRGVLRPHADRPHGDGLERRAGADPVERGLRRPRAAGRRAGLAAALPAGGRPPRRARPHVPPRPDRGRGAGVRVAALAPSPDPPTRPHRRGHRTDPDGGPGGDGRTGQGVPGHGARPGLPPPGRPRAAPPAVVEPPRRRAPGGGRGDPAVVAAPPPRGRQGAVPLVLRDGRGHRRAAWRSPSGSAAARCR